MSLQSKVTDAFIAQYGQPPQVVVRAPGRVNIIGEHTDYNDGFVLPMAIDRASWIALSPRDQATVTLHSLDMNDTLEFDLAAFENTDQGWAEYVKAVAWVLKAAGYNLTGWYGVMAGDVPIGSGLSSSAGLELAVARAFATVSQLDWNPANMARLAQRAENEWVGVNCGIMDQMISAAGIEGTALLIDCRSLQSENVPLPPGTAIVVMDTSIRRGLVDSAYNERRSQCESAAQFFGVTALRDVTIEQFNARADELDPLIRQRARHVVTENARTLAAADAMKAGDAVTLGRLMNESHFSLRDDYEVSSTELDTMSAIAREQTGCYGARMTGAGFGGCAVALVATEAAQSFAAAVTEAYTQQTGLTPSLYITHPTNGAEIISQA